jgi:FkbM family methyltransferase
MKKQSIADTFILYNTGVIDKATFISDMHLLHHKKLFEYSNHIANTNIQNISIFDNSVIMTIRSNGLKIECAQEDQRIAPIEILNFLEYEKKDSDMIERLFSDGQNFFDIGANIGWYSLNLAISRKNSNFYCFEPIPKTFLSLNRNISLNKLPNIKTFNYGFSKSCGTFDFYYYKEGSGNASMKNLSLREDVEKVECAVKTIDLFDEEFATPIDFMKCDVEGGELLVFEGGIVAIKKYLPIIFSEILRKWSKHFNYHPNAIFRTLENIGYKSYTSNGSHLTPFKEMNDETLETNFFFLHQDKHIQLIQKYELII